MPWTYFAFLLGTFLGMVLLIPHVTYHATFARRVWLVIVYGVLVGFALSAVESFWPMWVTQAWGSLLLLFCFWRISVRRGRRNVRAMQEVMGATDAKSEQIATLSMQSSNAYFWLSAVLYIVSTETSFLVFLNTR